MVGKDVRCGFSAGSPGGASGSSSVAGESDSTVSYGVMESAGLAEEMKGSREGRINRGRAGDGQKVGCFF